MGRMFLITKMLVLSLHTEADLFPLIAAKKEGRKEVHAMSEQ